MRLRKCIESRENFTTPNKSLMQSLFFPGPQLLKLPNLREGLPLLADSKPIFTGKKTICQSEGAQSQEGKFGD